MIRTSWLLIHFRDPPDLTPRETIEASFQPDGFEVKTMEDGRVHLGIEILGGENMIELHLSEQDARQILRGLERVLDRW